MFTGLVEMIGSIRSIEDNDGISQFTIALDAKLLEAKFGDSIAVNGCCLTVTKIFDDAYAFDVSRETLRVSNLGQLKVGDSVNLERAMRLGDRLGGHLVSGHVDGLGTIETINAAGDGWEVAVRLNHELSRYVIAKGSICLDGISLTVNQLKDEAKSSLIYLMIIPATLQETTLSQLKPGWQMNVEVDMMAKFLERKELFKDS